MKDDNLPNSSPIFLGIPFLMTTRTKIDVHVKILIIKFDGEIVEFNISMSCNHLKYIFLGNNETLLVIIVKNLINVQNKKTYIHAS
ncbi:hypothetical protein NC651_030453 [Populus alba x Populus x berolinensis]|nr:hypothetical protein NC651_030453 [Populus alba x Populus x berolinensis]